MLFPTIILPSTVQLGVRPRRCVVFHKIDYYQTRMRRGNIFNSVCLSSLLVFFPCCSMCIYHLRWWIKLIITMWNTGTSNVWYRWTSAAFGLACLEIAITRLKSTGSRRWVYLRLCPVPTVHCCVCYPGRGFCSVRVCVASGIKRRKILGRELPGESYSGWGVWGLSGGLLCGLYGRSTKRKKARFTHGVIWWSVLGRCLSVVCPAETSEKKSGHSRPILKCYHRQNRRQHNRIEYACELVVCVLCLC